MKQKINILFLGLLAVAFITCKPTGKSQSAISTGTASIITGANQTEKYLPLLKGKRVAILANPTTIIGNTHLVDSLQKLGINIVKVFGPEHGFRAMPVRVLRWLMNQTL